MTNQDSTGDGNQVLTLQDLIRARMEERGWSYGDLERRSAQGITKGRWQQLGTGVRQRRFPEPDNLRLMADVLEVDTTTVVLAAAQSVGLDARRRGPDLAHLLPSGTDRLTERMRDAILTIVRAAVAETLAADAGEDPREDASTLEWPKTESPTRRNARRRPGDRLG